MKSIISCVLLALSLHVIAGRSSTSNPTSTLPVGSFSGNVILFDSTPTLLTDFSGVRVTIDGTSIATTTDAQGHWQLDGIPANTYEITLTGPGFGKFHYYHQMLLGGKSVLETVGMAAMPAYTPHIDSVRLYPIAQGTMWHVGPYITSPERIEVVSFCDIDSTIQPTDGHLVILREVTSISLEQLQALGVQHGQRIYFSAATAFVTPPYILSTFSYQIMYTDPYHNFQQRCSSMGPKSNVVSIIMP